MAHSINLGHTAFSEISETIGFLLYLPGNLEAGSTAQAYIDTNTTETFTVELNFIHSSQDRHFYGSARIESGSGWIDVEIPDVDYWYGRVNLTGELEVSKTKFSASKNGIYIYRDAQKATFIETDKPLYKPGQEVKFRLVTIDSQFKPDISNIVKIQVESPNGIRLAQWRNVERPDGLVDLSFQLISDPPFGEYSIKAFVGENWVQQSFKVAEYVLPKFEVTISAAGFLLITAEEYSFQVCAKYTYGQPVRGYTAGYVGKFVKEYYYYRGIPEQDLLGEEEVEDELINRMAFSGDLDDQGCMEATIDVSEMELSSYDTPYWRTYIAVRATVIEATTGNELTETVSHTKLETTPMDIELQSAMSFKPGIPYQGRIKLTYPDGKDASNEEVNITAVVDSETVHSELHTADSDGIINFEVPFAVIDKSIRLIVQSTSYVFERNDNGYNVYVPRKTFYLDPAFSNTGRYIQIVPLFESVNAGDEVTIQLLYTSDDSSVSSDFKFQFVARNTLVDAGATREGESRRRRAVIVNGDNGETECQKQAREAAEKGPLGSFTLTCDENGLFNKSQCRRSTGDCWCVNQETGRELPMTRRQSSESAPVCQGAEEEPIEVPIGELGPPDVFIVCREGFSFAEGVKKCVVTIDESECQRQAREVDEKGLLGSLKLNCDEDGTFLADQCHGSSGNCWCVDTTTGLEIPDTRTGPTEANVECEVIIIVEESQCETQAREAVEKGLLGSFTPDCDENGTFLAEQCRGSSGHCWCVDIDTGIEIPETRTGPTEVNVECQEGKLYTTLPPVTLELKVRTPKPIVHVDPQALQETSISVTITPGMSPEARLLVYYTSPEGEVVADSITIKVNEAFENEVHLEFSEPEVTPGSETTLKVSAENGSLCGIGIIDKSVYVLGGENKLTPKKLFSVFDLSVRTVYNSRGRCSYGYYRYRKRRSIAPYFLGHYNTVTYTDSTEAFSNSGLITLSNYELDIAPCNFQPEIAYSVARTGADDADGASQERTKDGEEKIRSYFPSTWLWTLQRVSETPVEMRLPVPHTITDWIANGFCTNVNRGIGIASPVVLRAFQPFFLSMSLPYSIIRTEKTPIKVSVFNYLKQCLVVQVTLQENEGFVISGEAVHTVAVPAGEVTTVTFKVAAFVFGEIPLHVTAESISDDEHICGNEAVTGAAGSRDAVLRNLKVKPEGEPETTTESAYFCLGDGETYNKHISLNIPAHHVPGTAVGDITVTGDIIGKSLNNVEGMLRMPYGCGEQNLVSMVPNIVALQYLESIGEASPEITAEARKYILSGYQRELNYRRDDNSYSAFGNSNPSGSTFLTAFVVRTYAHAQMFVDIDEEDLFVTIDWLRSIQEKDGSFRTVGYLAHKAMKGGVNNNVTLAAYVVSTFLEAGYTTEDRTVISAFRYLNSQLDSLEDTYSTALLAYAYALADMDEFDEVYELLQASAINSEDVRHWESNREDLPSYASYYQDSAKAQNIEMTAYVLRAMIIRDIPNLAVEGSLIARWLVAQRNPRGGFSSTQDTVIGLTALAEFAEKLGTGESSDLTLTMNVRGGETLEFDVTFDNRFIVQHSSFEDFPAEISVSAEGQGCVLYSVSGDYYIKKEKQTLNPFSLDIKTKGKKPAAREKRETEDGEEEEETCDRFTISISARYNGEDGASNMAIINIRPVSGFVFDEESLKALKTTYNFVKRYEVNEDTTTFYFDEITNENIEFEIDVIKEFEVEDTKPAFITILDYYENDLKVAEEFEFVCADEEPTSPPTTTYTTPFSPTGYPSSSSTDVPDFDECSIPSVCGGPEYECINFPGTYECICAEGFALDETEDNCIAIPSCPVCDVSGLTEEAICGSDFVKVMKIRVDGTLRPLSNMLTKKDIKERIYYDVEIDEACTCDLLSSGNRIIVVASNGHIGPSSGTREERILLDDSAIVLPSISSVKKDIGKALKVC